MEQHIGGRPVFLGDRSNQWIVIRTKPRQEKAAVRHLSQRNVTTYCPMFLQPPWHPRAPRGPVPLFAGYIFVRCNLPERLNAVRYCPGVLAPVTFGGEIAEVEQGLIDALRAREGGRGYALPVEEEEGIRNGATVRVMNGPFEGAEGVFSGYLRGRQRAMVLLDFLRSRHRVEVDSTALALVRAG
jgi:transcriptional antiterminator RfaH